MVVKNEDLHGMVPDAADVALILLDVINDLEFEGAEDLFRFIPDLAERVAELKERCRQAEIPVVYVNDNYGRWRSDLNTLVDHCLQDDVRGRILAERLQPHEDDYFVLKPKHSGFYSTTLDTLLQYLRVNTLIIAGIAGNICVLFTANDAYMRDFELVVPSDCCASNDAESNQHALEQMRAVLKADVRPSAELDLAALKQRAARKRVAAGSLT